MVEQQDASKLEQQAAVNRVADAAIGAASFECAYQAEQPVQYLKKVAPLMLNIADKEQRVWERLINTA